MIKKSSFNTKLVPPSVPAMDPAKLTFALALHALFVKVSTVQFPKDQDLCIHLAAMRVSGSYDLGREKVRDLLRALEDATRLSSCLRHSGERHSPFVLVMTWFNAHSRPMAKVVCHVTGSNDAYICME